MTRTTSLLLRFCILMIVATVMLFAVGRHFYLSELNRPLSITEEHRVFEVLPGESFYAVIGRLQSHGLVTAPWVAKLYIKQSNIGSQLRQGEFAIAEESSLKDILTLLTSNQTIQYQVQFIEGTSYTSVLEALGKHPKVKQTLEGKNTEQLIEVLGLPEHVKHLEGQFYPDTYNFVKGESDVSILRRAHARLSKILQEEWDTRDKASPIKSPYEALILASIVEKETGVESEREEISGVFSRRLSLGMRLQTDPTVIYGLGDRYKGNIKRKHLREHTPYNTYRIKGLPPTPIALVGRAAIHAALHPKEGKSLYFVAKGDGTHKFSVTIDEHNKAVRQYQLKRRKDYRSTQ